VDCYTTWCVPCKAMSASVFPTKEVGEFYNDNFINVEYQFDSSSTDTPEIMSLYQDASFLKGKYGVKAYPTYLFFDPNGYLVHRDLGAVGPDEFITKGKNALNPETQYYTQVKKYEAGERDSAFLRRLTLLALYAMDDSSERFAKQYISRVANLSNAEDLKFINETTNNVHDTGFTIMLTHLNAFESAIGKEAVDAHLTQLITTDEFLNNPGMASWDGRKWDEYEGNLKSRYSVFADRVLLNVQVNIFEAANNWEGFSRAVEKGAAQDYLSAAELNAYAWAVFKQCNLKKILRVATRWSKKSFAHQKEADPGYIDTYSNLLYKLGRTKDAIRWEREAAKLAVKQGAGENWGEDVIGKMEKGEKTW